MHVISATQLYKLLNVVEWRPHEVDDKTHCFLVVLHQCVPDAAHGLLDLGVGVELVAVESWHDLRHVGSQLFPCLGGYSAEPKRCSLHKQHTSTLFNNTTSR